MRPTLFATALLSAALSLAQQPAPAPAAADFVAKLDEAWKTRDAPDSVKASNDAIRDGLQAYPESYDLLWRASRFRWWTADGTSEEKSKRMVAKAGWDYAARAAKANPAGMEAKYYTALSIGAYSQAVGILKALADGLEGQFVENLDAALKANEAFDHFGGRRAKGRYYWELPWPKRDLDKSKQELAKAIAGSPEHLRNYLYLADTLLKDGKAREAKVEVDKVLNGAADWDPPEARRSKAWAKTLAEAIAKEL